MFVVFVVGDVNSGKSSFINALAGQYVANVTDKWETRRPMGYILRTDAKPTIAIGKNSTLFYRKNRIIDDEIYWTKDIYCRYFDIIVIEFPAGNIDLIKKHIHDCNLMLYFTKGRLSSFYHKLSKITSNIKIIDLSGNSDLVYSNYATMIHTVAKNKRPLALRSQYMKDEIEKIFMELDYSGDIENLYKNHSVMCNKPMKHNNALINFIRERMMFVIVNK